MMGTRWLAPWTDERVATLKELVAEGLSAIEIADSLGGTSRRAVLGKAHRLGLSVGGETVPAPKPAAQPTPRPVFWTDERDSRLRTLADDGSSARKIAEDLGVSSTAIAKRAAKLGVKLRGRPGIAPNPDRPPRVRPAKAAAKPAAPAFVPSPDFKPHEVTPTAKRIADGIGHNECLFPVGEVTGADMLHCCAPKAVGSYCAEHARICFNPAARKSDLDRLISGRAANRRAA